MKSKKYPNSFLMRPGNEDLLKFDLQRHNDPEPNDPNPNNPDPNNPNDPAKSKVADKLVNFTDPFTKKEVQIPEAILPIIGHVITATRNDTDSKYKGLEKTLEELQTENEELKPIREEFERIKQEKMTAEERAQINAEKVIKEHEKRTREAIEKADKWEQLYKETIVRNEIMNAFGNHKLCNPEQVAILFEKEGKAKVEEKVDYSGKPTGQYETRVTLNIEDDKGLLNIEEGTPKELFSRWIKMDANSHHLQNDLIPGAGTSQKIKLQDGTKVNINDVKDPIARMNIAREGQQR